MKNCEDEFKTGTRQKKQKLKINSKRVEKRKVTWKR
jgi:hypothetical protein